MQILELLGSTASTAKVPQADLSSQKDAFVRHLDEVMSHREDMRGEDARLHASRQDNKDDPTARDDEPVDRADTRDERAPETEARDDTSSARESTAPAEKSAADETVVAPAEADVAKVLSGAMAQQDNSPDTLAAASGEEAVIGKAADDALLSENDQTVVPQEALNKASVNAAFNGNDKARAGNHVSDKAGPFDAAANIDAGDQAIASGAESGATVKDLPEFASEVAARTDMADLSDETQVASQVATQSNTQQVKAPGAETADARAAEAKASAANRSRTDFTASKL